MLTVGTDCAVGKKYTALAIEKEMRARGVDADFRATGQTGIFISGRGIAVDSVVSDFVSGAAEWLSPPAAPQHWDVIEGQGSLFHPAYAGVTLGLMHGSQPDALVLCHDVARTGIADYEGYPIPTYEACFQAYLAAARLTNRAARFAGVSLNTASLDDAAAARAVAEVAARVSLPCCDPIRHGVAADRRPDTRPELTRDRRRSQTSQALKGMGAGSVMPVEHKECVHCHAVGNPPWRGLHENPAFASLRNVDNRHRAPGVSMVRPG